MAIDYQPFVEGVQHRAELSAPEDAREIAVGAFDVLATFLDTAGREQVEAALPAKLRDPVNWNGARERSGVHLDVVAELAQRVGCPSEHARYLFQAVLSEVADQDEALSRMLRRDLPEELVSLFSAPGGGPPPQWAAAAADDRPRPLDSSELTRVLADLENWSGNTERISREVSIPRDRWTPLLNQVHAIEHELSHHAAIKEGQQDTLTFSLRTRSLATVTELDLQLARRIDDAVASVSSGG